MKNKYLGNKLSPLVFVSSFVLLIIADHVLQLPSPGYEINYATELSLLLGLFTAYSIVYSRNIKLVYLILMVPAFMALYYYFYVGIELLDFFINY